MSFLSEMQDDMKNENIISEVNKYDPLVRHIELLTDEEVKDVYDGGYITNKDVDKTTLIYGLQYFCTILAEDVGYLTFEYKKAIQAYESSVYLDKDVADNVKGAINQGTIRALFNIPTFKRKRELEREIEKVEIMNGMIYELTEMGGDKDQLALLKTMVNIAKDNENKLRDTRDFILLHIPEEEMVDSYVLLLNIINDLIPEYSRMNSVKAESIKSKIKADPFIKREQVIMIEELKNLE